MPVTKIHGSRQIADATILDAQIAAAAGIATSKLADGADFIKRTGTVAFTADQPLGGFKLTGLGAPVAASDAATKGYVDGVAQGIDIRASSRVATTANIALTGTQTIDGVAVVAGDRVLVKNQTAGADNGIWVVAAGAWARATDADTSAEVTAGMFTFIEEGTAAADTGWVLTTNNPITLGTTSLAFTQFTGAGTIDAGAGLTKTGSVIDVIAGDNSLTVAADNVVVKRDAAGAVGLTANGLTLVLDGSSVLQSGTGIKVNDAKFVVRETPTGAVNGVNTIFTLANTPIAGKEEVYLNGILQEPGAGNDYTISGLTITYLTAPASTDRLRVSYIFA